MSVFTRSSMTLELGKIKFKVVESQPDGIIVRGGLMAATHSVYSDEFLSTGRRKDARQDDPLYIAGEDPQAHERFKLSKLAWEYLGGSFAGRQLLFEEHSAGNLSRRRQQLMDNYDPNPVIGLAKRLAGIDVARHLASAL